LALILRTPNAQRSEFLSYSLLSYSSLSYSRLIYSSSTAPPSTITTLG
jgi:hypothetical protein